MSEIINAMFSSIADRYDITNDILSFGTHRLWRQQLIKFAEIKEGQKILDLCTGTGDLAIALKKKVGKNGEVVGLDFVQKMLERAKEKIDKTPLGDIKLIQADAANLPLPDNYFDCVTVSFGIRNVTDIPRCFAETRRVLNDKGYFVVLEFGQAQAPIFSELYQFYSKYFMPTIGGLLTGNKEAYAYLPRTANAFPCGEKFVAMLKEAGFKNIKCKALFSGLAYIYVAYK